ncbi:MAG: hypothetical protein F4018_07015, partial [Acidobacteria bacterium]|nr:hypothetical protein [Acidobacteriota bacterium]
MLHVVGLLSGLASAVFATAVRDRYGALALAAGFLIALVWLRPGPVWIGAVVEVTAGISRARDRVERR